MAAPRRLAPRTADIAPFRVMEVAEEAWQLRSAGRDIVILCVGEPDFGTPEPCIEAAARSMGSGRLGYTGALGIQPLRDAIAAYYGTRFGVAVTADRVAVTTGASGALLLALAALVGRDRELLLTDPGYPCNRHFTRLLEALPRGLPVGPDTDYQLTAALVDDAWSDATTGVLLASPSNPTGTVVGPRQLAAIADAVAAHDGVLLVDEIYGELVYDSPPQSVLQHSDDAVVINSFSKTFGMTGWRLGWLVLPEWAVTAVETLAQNLYISPPALAQHAGLAAFTPDVWAEVDRRREAFRERRDVLVHGLRSIGFGVPVLPQGAFYVYADISAFDDDSSRFCHRLLHEAGVAVTPGDDFGRHRANEHVRVSYAASLEHLHDALDRLAALLA